MNEQTRTRLVDEAVDAYVSWLEESANVQAAYERWGRASRGDSLSAFTAYWAAVDREERACEVYANLVALVVRLGRPTTRPGTAAPRHGSRVTHK